MYIEYSAIREMTERYGIPEKAVFEIESSDEEVARIKSSQKNGRDHDVTVYAFKDDKVIVIAKPFYPPGMFRAPSGGIDPGEDFEAGTEREMREETGCEIALEHFLLLTKVSFVSENDHVDWRSFVFQARYVSGDFEFTDTNEIREVKLAALDEFEQFGKIMRRLDLGGLKYRAALHEKVEPLLKFD